MMRRGLRSDAPYLRTWALGFRPGGRSAPVQGGQAGHPPLTRRNAPARHAPFSNGL